MRQLPEFRMDAQEVAVIEPCTQDAGAFMVDFNLFQFLEKKGNTGMSKIDFKILNEHVRSISNMTSQVQISERLGICKIMCPTWEVIIARSGRIVVRRAKNREIIDLAVNFTFKLLDNCLI
jgi:hypothetical protein